MIYSLLQEHNNLYIDAYKLQEELPQKRNFLCRVLVALIGSFISQKFSRIVVHPLFNLLDLLVTILINVCSFWDKTPNKTIGIFITAALPESYRDEHNQQPRRERRGC